MLATGRQKLERMRDGRAVYIGAERVDDVTVHPAFRRGAQTIAALYDLKAAPEKRDLFSYEENGERYALQRLRCRSRDDLTRRMKALRATAEATYGFIGRSPEQVAGLITGLAMNPSVLENRRAGREAPWDRFHRIVDGLLDGVDGPGLRNANDLATLAPRHWSGGDDGTWKEGEAQAREQDGGWQEKDRQVRKRETERAGEAQGSSRHHPAGQSRQRAAEHHPPGQPALGLRWLPRFIEGNKHCRPGLILIHIEEIPMKPVPFLCAAVVALSLACAPALYAETAAQPGATSQKAPTQKEKAKTKEKAAARPEGAHSTEAEARRACATGTVVWVNSASKIYHAGGTRPYGKTRSGFYMCEANAERLGFRPVKAPTPKGKKKDSKKA